jgi:hypothetical protein
MGGMKEGQQAARPQALLIPHSLILFSSVL